jgi:hypothetical protein
MSRTEVGGRVGDGFICTSGKPIAPYDQLLAALREGTEQASRDVTIRWPDFDRSRRGAVLTPQRPVPPHRE